MLKRLGILTLALVAFSVQAHAQAKQEKDDAQSGKPAAPISVALAQPKASQEIQPADPKHVNADVRVISSPAKDGYDKAAFWATIALVVVGFLGVGAAFFTLKAINKQADLMKEQLDTSRQKERPKLRIELQDLDLRLINSPDMLLIQCTIHNYGGSGAFIAGSTYGCWLGKADDSKTRVGLPMLLPDVLLPGGKPIDPFMFVPDEEKATDYTLWSGDDRRIEAVRKGEAFVYLTGCVIYGNIFDESWILSFKRKFTIRVYDQGICSGCWSREGGDAGNYERRSLPFPQPEPMPFWKRWVPASNPKKPN